MGVKGYEMEVSIHQEIEKQLIMLFFLILNLITVIIIFTNYPHWFQPFAGEMNFFSYKHLSSPVPFLGIGKAAFVDK